MTPTSLLGPSMMAEILALSSAEADETDQVLANQNENEQPERVIKNAENVKASVTAKRAEQAETSALLLSDLDLLARAATAGFVDQSAIPESWRRILGSVWFRWLSAAGLIGLLASIVTNDVLRRKREQRDLWLWD